MTYDMALHGYNKAAQAGNHAEAIRLARIVREKENASANVSREHWNSLIAKHKAAK